MSDDVDIANDRRDAELANRIAEFQWQLGHAVSAHADIEAETCNGCAYATKAAWGRTCDGWKIAVTTSSARKSLLPASIGEGEMKTCIKCGETKLLDDFTSSKNASGGKLNVCKKCSAAYRRKHRVATSAYGKPMPRMAAITKSKKQNDIARYGEAVVEALDATTGLDEDLRHLIGDTYR